MNNWLLNTYDRIVRKLVKEPWRRLSYFLSHGFFHSIMCFVVGILTALLWYYNYSSSDTTMHNISLEVKPPYTASTIKDSLHTLSMSFELDSDSLYKKTKKKYKSRISITYGYDYTCRDSEYVDTPKEPTILKLYSQPLLDDLYLEQDSISITSEIKEIKENETYNGISHSSYKLLSDSVFEINVKPFKNIINETGGENGVGSQTVYMYSNNLGLIEGDCYYNYFIDFGRMPTIKQTNNFSGLIIRIQIGDETNNKGLFFIENKRLLYQYIYPQPDILKNGFLFYYTKEAISKVQANNGIIIQATDIDAMNKINKKSIIYSVLVGTGAALFLDILIQLVRELRNMNRRKEEEERREKEQVEKGENNVSHQ